MAASLHLLLFSFIFHTTCFASEKISLPNSLLLPVRKDVATLQYTTQIFMGTDPPHIPTKLILDLGGSSLWVDCASSRSASSIRCGSLQCSMAKSSQVITRSTGFDQKSSTCDCELYPENTITGMVSSGKLAEDILAADYTDGQNRGSIAAAVDGFLFSCAPTHLLNGLASGAKGMLGLGKTRISLPSQLADKFDFSRKFALCLSSSEGVIVSGGSTYLSVSGTDISKSLSYTPLVSIQDGSSQDYYVNLKSIRINGKKLSLNGPGIGGAKISTVVPYTTMETTIYDTFTKAYVQVATNMNMTKVAPVAPFGVCFSSKGVDKTRVGPAVPFIDLVLQSEMVKWRIYGRNSMVHVSNEAMCLGFLDGGELSTRTPIVIGAYQLEDHLLSFNLGTSMLGFSSSLLMEQTSCSSLGSVSMPRESL